MSRALSLDLRIRVLSAVRAGMSHRAAGARFGVSATSVSRWRTLEREQGDARPKALGGDRRSGRIEAQRGVMLSLLEEEPDMTIDHIVYDRLASRLVVPGSFEELVYSGSPLSDHCPIAVTLDMRRR